MKRILLAMILVGSMPALAWCQAPPYVTQWGTSGAGDGQFDYPAGMAVDPAGNTTTCTGITGILGTGMDIINPPPQYAPDPGWCGFSNRAGGGTGWLTTSGNVTPGETIEMRFVVWDTGDGYYDSVVLLDNWIWAATPATPGTHN